MIFLCIHDITYVCIMICVYFYLIPNGHLPFTLLFFGISLLVLVKVYTLNQYSATSILYEYVRSVKMRILINISDIKN
jgi:hypothetical protein